MKAFCYVGSNSPLSMGIELGLTIQNILVNENISTFFYSSKDFPITLCQGCLHCFNQGKCPLDTVDGFSQIKKAMKEADIIILISPVYANNVSGAMKNYIDRLSYWLHTLELARKIGIVISVTDNSGSEFVNYYLEKILTYSGCHVTGKYSIIKIDIKKSLQKMAKQIVQDVKQALLENQQNISNKELENHFQTLKKMYSEILKSPEMKNYEVNYWYQTGMISFQSYQDFLLHLN